MFFLNLEKERPCSYTWGWQTGLLVRYWLGRKKEYNVRSTMLANTTRCRNPLPESRKNGLGTGDNFPEAEGLLLGILGGGVDKPTSKADSSQTRHVRMIGEMGSGTGRIWIVV